MKRVILALAFALCAAPVFAQNTSTSQMVLVGGTPFQGRLSYLFQIEAKVVLQETKDCSGGCSQAIGDTGQNVSVTYTPACHSQRTAFAAAIVGGGAPGTASILIASSNVAGAVFVGPVTGSGATADSTASDLALATAIANFWNTLSKCVTNP
jgi:hypothetical protein